jgi:sodium pump decarboxylase gamma subunit
MFLALAGETTLSMAVANTLMGMGVVFAVLLFIMAIIYLFAFIPKIQDAMAKKNAAQAVEPVKVQSSAPAVSKAPASDANLMNDAQLVAVITAAVVAASESAGAASKDSLIVRSIRRAR